MALDVTADVLPDLGEGGEEGGVGVPVIVHELLVGEGGVASKDDGEFEHRFSGVADGMRCGRIWDWDVSMVG